MPCRLGRDKLFIKVPLLFSWNRPRRRAWSWCRRHTNQPTSLPQESIVHTWQRLPDLVRWSFFFPAPLLFFIGLQILHVLIILTDSKRQNIPWENYAFLYPRDTQKKKSICYVDLQPHFWVRSVAIYFLKLHPSICQSTLSLPSRLINNQGSEVDKELICCTLTITKLLIIFWPGQRWNCWCNSSHSLL